VCFDGARRQRENRRRERQALLRVVSSCDEPGRGATGGHATRRRLRGLRARPRASTLQPLPLSPEGVRIGLGEDLIKELAPDAAEDPASWRIDTDRAFRGYVGPFSALMTIRSHVQGREGDPGLRKSGDMTVSVGPHPHCASPPVPAPSGLTDERRVSVQPTDDSFTSCLAWFSVDFFLDSDRDIVAVTLDLWEP
jgi:hypothetical protein